MLYVNLDGQLRADAWRTELRNRARILDQGRFGHGRSFADVRARDPGGGCCPGLRLATYLVRLRGGQRGDLFGGWPCLRGRGQWIGPWVCIALTHRC